MTTNRIPFISGHAPPADGRSRGFTLIELMVTIVVLAILLSLALPNYRSFITSTRLTAQINDLVGDLSLARNEAGARSRQVHVCIAASSTACANAGSDWAAGRIIWADTNGNGTLDAGSGEIIKYSPSLEGGVSLIASGPASTNAMVFLPYGRLSGGNTWTFKLCSPGEATGRQVTIPYTGRATAERIETCT